MGAPSRLATHNTTIDLHNQKSWTHHIVEIIQRV